MECVLILSHCAELTKSGKTGLISAACIIPGKGLVHVQCEFLCAFREGRPGCSLVSLSVFTGSNISIDHRIPEGFGLQGTLKLSCSTPCHGHGHLPQAPPNLTLNWTSEGPIPGEGPDVKCYKTQLKFRAKTVALVLGTKRWDGFGTVKGYSERVKGVEL